MVFGHIKLQVVIKSPSLNDITQFQRGEEELEPLSGDPSYGVDKVQRRLSLAYSSYQQHNLAEEGA